MLFTDPMTWFLVFARAGAMLAVFPVFSSTHVPVQLRIALGALLALFVSAALPPVPVSFGGIAMEIGVGLLLGFVARLLFFALDAAGSIMATEMGLMLAADFDPLTNARTEAPGMMLNLLGLTLFMTLNLHHWVLIAFQRSYDLVPIGGAHANPALLPDFIARTAGIFVIAVQIAAPLIAVSFVITLVFSVLGRAVPQMNVFTESFAFRSLAGLTVFGLTLHLMAQHIINYLQRLPEDCLTVAALVGGR